MFVVEGAVVTAALIDSLPGVTVELAVETAELLHFEVFWHDFFDEAFAVQDAEGIAVG